MVKTSVELTHDFFDLWLKTYESTYGRIFEAPAVGPMRERYEKLASSVSTSVDFYTTWLESLVNLQNVFTEAMRRMREKMVTEMKEGKPSDETYREFYRLWIETYSETFKEFLKSGHFSSDMGRLTSYFMDLQKSNRDMLEEYYLKPGGLPTKREIDEINKEVYILKKQIKELTGRIKELSSGR